MSPAPATAKAHQRHRDGPAWRPPCLLAELRAPPRQPVCPQQEQPENAGEHPVLHDLAPVVRRRRAGAATGSREQAEVIRAPRRRVRHPGPIAGHELRPEHSAEHLGDQAGHADRHEARPPASQTPVNAGRSQASGRCTARSCAATASGGPNAVTARCSASTRDSPCASP